MKNYETCRSCPSGSFSYTIKSGDTLYKLAITYNTTVEAIMRLNTGIDPNNLKIGQQICIPGRVPGPGPGPNCPRGTFEYTIKSGDTIYKLAMKYNTTVEAILRVNPGINPNNLQIGQRICIPESGSGPGPRCPVGTFEYTIRSGDTIYNLAMKYNTTVEAILRVNPGLDPNNLRVGQSICIPGQTPPKPRCPVGTFEYTIKAGDSIYNLANKYNTTVEAILRVNPGLNPNNLQIGQMICIPRDETPMPPCDGVYYTVRPGDSFYSIAVMFNITVGRLMAANPGVDPDNLRIGQVLCIPRMGPPPITCPGGTIYEVRANDDIVTILLRFHISIMDLMKANPNVDLDKLATGQKLCIMPHKDWGCPCPRGAKQYEITSNDVAGNELTVIYLARKYNITVEELMKINPNLRPNDFVVGKIICVPM